MDRADDEAERKILAIIRREKDCSLWQRLNLHWANTFEVKASVRFRLRMEMAESWSLTHKKEDRM